MTVIVRPMCLGCKHFDAAAESLRCDAFPEGIPDAITKSKADHRLPIAGDNGIQFEADTKADAEYASNLFGDLVR